MRRLALLAAIALFTVACLGSDFADSIDGSWQLESGTIDGEAIQIIATHPIVITFEGDQVSGTASCNTYAGSFDLDGLTITFGDLAMTEMACFPEETMEAEAMYSAALLRAATISLDDTLTLSGEGVELVFAAEEPTGD